MVISRTLTWSHMVLNSAGFDVGCPKRLPDSLKIKRLACQRVSLWPVFTKEATTSGLTCSWSSLSSINLSALRHRADQKQNNGIEREERGERPRQCKHRDKDMVTSPPHHIYTLSMTWWPHSSLATMAMLSSRKSSFNLNLRLELSGLITTVISGTERSLIFHKIWSNCTESCTLGSNAMKRTLGRGKKYKGKQNPSNRK